MFNKSLVSIYFLENKILVAELDAKKTKVHKFASVEIPKGLIENYKVQDKLALAKVLKGIWSKFGFSEKSVGIIIPEFSTFSKLLKLPKLSLQELNEAALWQAQEYLPDGSDNMIIDWKIVEKIDSGYEVLIAAIPKEILMGYVSACELAGLYPHGVLTPSICLTNLVSKNDKGGNLIVYSGINETILIICIKEKILGTSVVQNNNQKEALDTAVRMINHFKQIEVKNIYVGGKSLSDELVDGLKNNLKIDVSLLDPKLTGIDQQTLMELIVPVSLLIGELKEPADQRTLNLLPPNLVDKYKVEKTRVQVWSLTLTITLFTWFCFLIVLGSYLVIGQQITLIKAKNLEKADRISAALKNENDAKKVNEITERILKIKSASIFPETVFNVILSAKTAGVNIEKYNMDFEKGRVEVVGKSADRESLILFKQNLEKNSEVKDVQIPLTNFENVTNLEFTLSFQYGSIILPTTAVPKVNVDIVK